METQNSVATIPQYSLRKILLVWALAAVPMALLGWVVAPIAAKESSDPIFTRLLVMTAGLVWQFLLVMFLVVKETKTFRWSVLRKSLWLTSPTSRTGETRRKLWWWLIPVLVAVACFEFQSSGIIDKAWVGVFPFLSEPHGFSLSSAIATPEAKAQLAGAWNVWGVFLLSAVFTFLGEELLFRGLLLPRMKGVFKNGDWFMNGLLFGLYHLHQPWMIPSAAVEGIVLFALPTRLTRSSWFGIIAHSAQSIYFAVLLLGLVLGIA